jgi:flotillin
MVAQGKRAQTVAIAQAEAESIRLIGAAEASSIEAIGKAEAEKMKQKAAAYKQYGDAAMMSLILESLPKLAAEVAAPLAKTDQVVILGSQNGATGEITKLIGQLPPAVQALTGVDLSGALGKIPGAKSS